MTLIQTLTALQKALQEGNHHVVRTAQTELSSLLAPLDGRKPFDLRGVSIREISDSPVPLSLQEARVFGYIQLGLSNKEIAKKMSLSPDTIKQYLSSIYRKYEVDGRRGLRLYLQNNPYLVLESK